MQRKRLTVPVLVVWLSSCFSLPLEVHLWHVLFYPRALSDGQYLMVFIFGIAAGVFFGLVPVMLTVNLTKRKPQFAQIALWSALGYGVFWAVVTTACEAIFIGREWVGGGVLATLLCMVFFMPLSLVFVPLFILASGFFLPSVFRIIAALSPLLILLLIAFYFTPPRGWGVGSPSQDTFQANGA